MIRHLLSLGFGLAVPATAQTWEPVPPPVPGIDRLEIDPTDSDHLVVWDAQTGWYETADTGSTWTSLIPPTTGPGLFVQTFTFDSQGELQAVLGQGSQGAGPAYQLSMVRRAGTWIPYGPTLGASDLHYGTGFVRGRANPDLVAYTAIEPFEFGGARLYLSDDDGATWTSVGDVWQFGRVQIVETSAGPHLVRFSDASDYANFRYRIERSSAWGSLDQVLFAVYDQDFTFLFAERHPERMVRVISEFGQPAGPIEGSVDGGLTWQPTSPVGAHSWMGIHPVRPDWLVRKKLDNMEVSTDNGATWAQVAPAGGFRNFAFSGDGNYLYAWTHLSQGIQRLELSPFVGALECSAALNGTGAAGRVRATGSTSAAANALTLIADRLTPEQFGMFLVSETDGFVTNPAGSFGNLCLGGAIGRYRDSIQSSGVHGSIVRNLDLTRIPAPSQYVAASAGQTWRFQLWYRDAIAGVQGSNFTDAVALTVTP